MPENLTLAHALAEYVRRVLHGFVACAMAERRDDAVEAVEREAHHAYRARALERPAQLRQQQLAIRQPRQAVVMSLVEDVPLAVRDGLLHRVEAAGELTELVGRVHVDLLVVNALAHAPRGRDEILHGSRDGLREPERAADRERERQARDQQQDVADVAVRLRRVFHRELQRDVHVARVVQERPQQRQEPGLRVACALRVVTARVEARERRAVVVAR